MKVNQEQASCRPASFRDFNREPPSAAAACMLHFLVRGAYFAETAGIAKYLKVLLFEAAGRKLLSRIASFTVRWSPNSWSPGRKTGIPEK